MTKEVPHSTTFYFLNEFANYLCILGVIHDNSCFKVVTVATLTFCKVLNTILPIQIINTWIPCQTRNGRQNKKRQQTAMHHCELQQVPTNRSVSCHRVQNLCLVPARAARVGPPQLAGPPASPHLGAHKDTSCLSLQFQRHTD